MIRVTKYGGVIKIFPIYNKDYKGRKTAPPSDLNAINIKFLGHIQYEAGDTTLELIKLSNPDQMEKTVQWCIDKLYLYDPSEYDPIVGMWKLPWEKWGQ